MKVLHISTYEKKGGAAIAAFRLNEAMNRYGIDSKMLVCRVSAHSSENPYLRNARWIKLKQSFLSHCSQLFQKYCLKSEFVFSLGHFGIHISKLPEVVDADVIYIHWINHNFLSIKEIHRLLRLGKPVVIFMHDMWAITGGCHHSFECKKYESECKKCPDIHRDLFRNVVSSTFKKKKRLLSPYKNLYVIASSQWMSDCVKRSALFGTHFLKTIPLTIDLDVFKPYDKTEACKILELSPAKRYILFAANGGDANPHKGWSYFKKALSLLNKHGVEALVLGSTVKEEDKAGLPIRSMGYFRDEHSLALLYSAADVLVVPSLAESFGQVIVEAFACGTLAVGFNVGGIPDLIKHLQTGYLADYNDSASLSSGIEWALVHGNDADLKNNLQEFVRQNISYNAIARQHVETLKRCISDLSE